jgi:type 1 fimbria pilin
VASLSNGSMTVKLNTTAGAYVEAGGSRFTAAAASHFHIEVNDGEVTLNTISGTVSVDQQPAGQTRYILRPPAGQGNALSVSARSTRQVQIHVTDEHDRPVPDLPILFALDNGCLGTLGVGIGAGLLFKGKTDKRGIAAVPWVTGAAKCAGTIVAKVEGTDAAYTYRVQVRTTGFFTTQNTLLVAAGAAAAGVGVGVAVANSGGNSREPITPVPPPGIKP